LERLRCEPDADAPLSEFARAPVDLEYAE